MAPRLAGSVTLVRSVGLGAAAYVVGYLLTFAWVGDRLVPIAGDVLVTVRGSSAGVTLVRQVTLATHLEPFSVSAATWTGWVFYSAHFVPLSLGLRGRGVRGSVPNIVLEADSPALVLLFFVPPLLLVVAGGLSAVIRSPPPMDGLMPRGAGPGMAVTAGYLPLTVAGAFRFAVGEPMGYSGVAPNLLWGILVMGLGYPLVFGGLGGWITTNVRDSNPTDSAPDTEYSLR